MTANGSTPIHGKPLCGAKKHQGEGTCRRPAGWGTPHPGIGRCKLHGGSAPSSVVAAQRVQATQLLEGLIWNRDAAPVTDTVGEMQRLAGSMREAVDVLGARLDSGNMDSVEAIAWVRVLRELRQILADMERLGIASRGLDLAEQYGGEIAGVLQAVLARLELSAVQRELVLVVVPEELRRAALSIEGSTES
jgi:hypothetical protein